MPSEKELLRRTGSSQEKRHWVRLTRTCNNRCLFCLDSECQDGVLLDESLVMEDVRRGLAEGARRLILSGGEPTIHPRFVEIVRRSVGLGYRWIQAISNGRRFAYPAFTEQAARAGLNEVTVSMHGHEAALHDGLTMAPGSFDQAVAGIGNLLRTGCHVSVDIVVSRRNVGHLARIVERFAALGVSEFDILLIQPFGRAWENRDLLLGAEAAPALRRGLRKARSLGCWVWTNRVPPAFLDGMEELIQSPAKLLDDVGGRRELFRRSIREGVLPDCRGERCASCVLGPFCERFFEVLGLTAPAGAERKRSALLRKGPFRVTLGLGAAPWERASEVMKAVAPPGGPGTLEIIAGPGVERGALRRVLGYPRVTLRLHSEDALEHVLPAPGIRRIEVEPELAGVLERFDSRCRKVVIARKGLDAAALPPGVSALLYLPGGDVAREIERGPDLGAVAGRGRELRVENVPPCLSGGEAAWPAWPYLDTAWFDDDMRPDPMEFAKSFVAEMAMTKSMRCRGCSRVEACRGIHVHYVMVRGTRALRPIGGGGRGKRRRGGTNSRLL